MIYLVVTGLVIASFLFARRYLLMQPREADDGGLLNLLVDGCPAVASQLPQTLARAIEELRIIPTLETASLAEELIAYLRRAAKPVANQSAWPAELAVKLGHMLSTTVPDWHRGGLISVDEKEQLCRALRDVLTCIRELLYQDWLASDGHRAQPS